MKKILAPHKEQDGWRYVRTPLDACMGDMWTEENGVLEYRDDKAGSRIISSRRVERAVETDDFLRLCAEDGLKVMYSPGYKTPWSIMLWPATEEDSAMWMSGSTLREAYYRYKAAAGEQS